MNPNLGKKSIALALSLSLAVVVSGAYVAQAKTMPSATSQAAAAVSEVTLGFNAAFGDIPARLAAKVDNARINARAKSRNVVAYATPDFSDVLAAVEKIFTFQPTPSPSIAQRVSAKDSVPGKNDIRVGAGLAAVAEAGLSVGEQAAMDIYDAINNFFSFVDRSVTNFFAATPTPTPPAVVETEPPAQSTTVAPASPPRTSTGESTVTNVTRTSNSYPTYTTVVQGVSAESLAALRTELLTSIANSIRPVAAQTVTNASTIQMVAKIQDISDVIIRSGDIRNSIFDNGVRVSATSGSFTALSSGATTISGDLTVSGTITPGTISAGNSISAPYFTATSTTATSTFAGSINVDSGALVYATTTRNFGIGTTTPGAKLSVEGSSLLGNIATAGYFVSTSTSATSTFAGRLAIGTTTPFGNGIFTVGTTSPLLQIDGTNGNIGIGTSSPYSTLSVVGNIVTTGTLTASSFSGAGGSLTLGRIGASTYSTVQDLQNIFHSAGWVSGGTITDLGGGDVSVSAGTGLIRISNSATAEVDYFDWTASSTITATANAISYIGVEYNSGSPRVTMRTTENWNYKTDFPLGRVVREGSRTHLSSSVQGVGDHAANMIRREYETMPLARDERDGGLVLSESADNNRRILVTAGVLWDRLNRYSISATSTAALDTYYGTTLNETATTTWDNKYYNSSGTLTELTAGKYGVLWFYVETDGDVVMVYGTNQHDTSAAAESQGAPATLPNRIVSDGKLIGRLIFLKGATTAVQTQSSFTTTFTGVQATNHANLTNLNWSASGHFFDAALNLLTYNLLTTGGLYASSTSIFGGSLGIGTSSPYSKLSVAGEVVGQNYVATSTTAVSSFQQLLVNASTTLQNFTFANATGTSATTTNFFSTTASSTNLFAQTASLSTLTLENALAVSGGGTGLSTVADGSLLFGSGGTTLTALATTSAAGRFLTLDYTTGRPSWVATSSLNVALSNTTGTLTVASGGTGQSTFTSSQLLYGNGTAALSSVATSSLSLGLGLSGSNMGYLIGGSSPSLSIATSSLYTGTTGQFPYFSDTNTLTATSSIFLASSGNVGIGTTTPLSLLAVAGSASIGANYNIAGPTNGLIVQGNVGIGTTSPFRALSITGAVSTAQQAIAYDQTNNTDILTSSVGDMFVYPSGKDALFNDSNLWVCTGGSGNTNGCPSGTPSGQGNLIVETRFGVASSTPFAAISVGADGAIVTTEKSLTDGATVAIDWTQGNQQRVVLGGNRAITFSNYIPGQTLRLVLCQDGTGSRTITSWPAAILWGGGSAPTLTTTANKCDVITLLTSTATGTIQVLGSSVLNF